MKKIIGFLGCFFSVFYTVGQTITISNSSVYLQRTFPNESCAINPRSKIYPTGTYTRSSTDFNGKPQYEKNIGLSGGLVCVNGGGSTTLADDKFYVRWVNNTWRLVFITSVSPMTTRELIINMGTGPFPTCRASGATIVGGADCYCQTSMILTGTAISTPRYSQTTINSTQIVGNSTNLLYQAGNSVSLNTGFQVSSGGIFEAKIATCN